MRPADPAKPVVLFCILLLHAQAWATPQAERDGSREAVPQGSTPREVELGKSSTKELESLADFKLVDDPVQVKKLNAMAAEIGSVSERPKIAYVVKIFDDKDPNAFTLPGGHIYVSNGLLNFVRSDHELASVLAHEIAHNSKMHHMKLMAKERRFQLLDLVTKIGAAMAASNQSREAYRTNDAGKLYAPLIFQQSIMAGLINRYSIEHERDADASAINYMVKLKYNPVGLLTFMERLSVYERRRPETDYGVFMTHPPTAERVQAAIDRLKELGLRIDRSAASTHKPSVESVNIEHGGAAVVRVGKIVLFKLSGSTPDEAMARARDVADAFERVGIKGARSFDFRSQMRDGTACVMADKDLLVRVTQEDVALNEASSAGALAQQWVENVRKLLLRDSLIGGGT